mgnify:CR=1 FL=1
MVEWQKSDWRKLPRVQMPDYVDAAALEKVEAQLSNYPVSYTHLTLPTK